MNTSFGIGESESNTRKAWEEPRIVLERSLVVTAQGVGPQGAPPFIEQPQGMIGPLGTSGNSGSCGA